MLTKILQKSQLKTLANIVPIGNSPHSWFIRAFEVIYRRQTPFRATIATNVVLNYNTLFLPETFWGVIQSPCNRGWCAIFRLIVLPINMGEMFFTNIFIQQFSFVYCEPKCFTPQLSHLLNKTRVFLSWPMTLSAQVTISPPGRPVSIPVAGTSQGGLPLQCLKLSPPRSCGPSEIPFFSLISLLFSSWIDFRPRHRVAESVITFGTCFICFRNSES